MFHGSGDSVRPYSCHPGLIRAALLKARPALAFAHWNLAGAWLLGLGLGCWVECVCVYIYLHIICTLHTSYICVWLW